MSVDEPRKGEKLKKTLGAPFRLFKLLEGEYYRASFYQLNAWNRIQRNQIIAIRLSRL